MEDLEVHDLISVSLCNSVAVTMILLIKSILALMGNLYKTNFQLIPVSSSSCTCDKKIGFITQVISGYQICTRLGTGMCLNAS